MKKFSFSLERVMEYKQQVLEGLQNEHAQILARVLQAEEELRRQELRYAQMQAEFQEKRSCGMHVQEACCYDMYARRLEREIAAVKEHLAEVNRLAEEKRLEVVAMKQEVTSIEKLREKKLEQYQKDVQKAEELFIEEFVSNARSAV